MQAPSSKLICSFASFKHVNSFEIFVSRVGAFVFLLLASLYMNHEYNRCRRANAINNSRRVWSSETSMDNLYQSELDLIRAMGNYVEYLQNKIDTLQSGLARIKANDQVNREKLLGNPFFKFRLLRRLRAEWKAWHYYIQHNNGQELLENMQLLIEEIPEFSFKEASMELAATHNSCSENRSNTDNSTTEPEKNIHLDSWDCFALALVHFNGFDFGKAESWLESAMRFYDKDKETYSALHFNYSSIENLYIANLLKQEKVTEALTFIGATMERDSKNTKFKQMQLYMKDEFDNVDL